MCEPMTMTALALSAAGTYAQARGAAQSQKAMSNAQAVESARQKNLRAESDTLFNESLGKQDAGAQTKRLADTVAERQAAAEASQVSAPVAEIPVQGGAPTIVADETASRVSQGNAKALNEARLSAALQGYGDLQLGNALMNTRYGQKQANVARFMRDSQDVLGTELEAASHKGDKMKAVGGGLQIAGSLVGMAGAMGYNPFAAANQATSLGVSAIGPNGLPVANGAQMGVTSGGRLVSLKPPGF